MIESYSFGRMKVAGKEYSSDLIIYPDGRVQASWWRQQGHRLVNDDIRELIIAEPELIVAGTGASGLMRPAAELEKVLAGQGIEFVALPTGQAIDYFNEQMGKKRAGGCFHLTC